MNCLVTGGTGFIGRHLVRRLTAENWDVYEVRRQIGNTDYLCHHHGAEFVCDLRDLVETLRPSICFHLATYFRVRHNAEDVAPMVSANILFGASLLEVLSRVDRLRFVNIETFWQHPQFSSSPLSLYSATKSGFSEIAAYYRAQVGVDVRSLVMTDTYGREDPRNKIVNLLLNHVGKTQVMLASPGNQLINLVHVDDACSSILALGTLPVAGEPRYWCFNAEWISIRDLAVKIEEISSTKLRIDWGAIGYRGTEMFSPWVPEPTVPTWIPKVSLEDGLRSML